MKQSGDGNEDNNFRKLLNFMKLLNLIKTSCFKLMLQCQSQDVFLKVNPILKGCYQPILKINSTQQQSNSSQQSKHIGEQNERIQGYKDKILTCLLDIGIISMGKCEQHFQKCQLFFDRIYRQTNEKQLLQFMEILQFMKEINQQLFQPIIIIYNTRQQQIKQKNEPSSANHNKQSQPLHVKEAKHSIVQQPLLHTQRLNSKSQDNQIGQKIQEVLEEKMVNQLGQVIMKKVKSSQMQPIPQTELKQLKKEEERCRFHNKQYLYFCQQPHYDGCKYLCNMCLFQPSRRTKHKGHRLICKIHQKQIKYRIQRNEQQQKVQDLNILLCQLCVQKAQERHQIIYYKQLLDCHLSQVKFNCIEQVCVKNNNFKVCSVEDCQNYTFHQDHRKLQPCQQQFLDYFKTQQQIIQQYQSYYLSGREKLKLQSLLKKAYKQYLRMVDESLLYLQSFTASSKQWAKKWIDRFFYQQDRNKSLFVLLKAKSLKDIQYREQQKRQYLELLNHLLEKQIITRFHQVSNAFKNCGKNIEKIFELCHDQDIWDKKHQILYQNQILENSCSLIDIRKESRKNVKAIYILKSNHEQSFQQINKKKTRKIRQMLKDNVKVKVQQFNFNKQQEKQIKNQFYSVNYLHQYKDNSQYSVFVKELLKQKESIMEQFSQKQKLSIMTMLDGFQSLKVLHIDYKKNLQGYFDYEIEASQIFKIIHSNENIQNITIKGIRICGLSLFIKHLKLIQKYLINQSQNATNISPFNQQSYILTYKEEETGEIEEVNLTSRKQDLSWIKKFSRSSTLHVSIEADLSFNFSCQSEANQQINNFQYLLRRNIIFSNINFKINLYRNDSIEQIKHLLSFMRKMKTIKITIIKYQLRDISESDPFCFLLQNISTFTMISSLELRSIIFCQELIKSPKAKTLIQYFDALCKNNQIINFKSIFCILPILPPFKDLTSIVIQSCKITKKLSNLINDNKQLRIVKISQILILNQQKEHMDKIRLDEHKMLQTLQIGSDIIDLKDANLNQLLYLKIIFQTRSQSTSILASVFPKLHNVVQLKIIFKDNFNFTKYTQKDQENKEINYQLLISIPSSKLTNIHIQRWDRINNNDIKKSLQKWDLKQLVLHQCPQINKDLFKYAQLFQNLSQLKVDRIYQKMQILRKIGVKVTFYQ